MSGGGEASQADIALPTGTPPDEADDPLDFGGPESHAGIDPTLA
jgi:hypothetical protein